MTTSRFDLKHGNQTSVAPYSIDNRSHTKYFSNNLVKTREQTNKAKNIQKDEQLSNMEANYFFFRIFSSVFFFMVDISLPALQTSYTTC